MSGRDGPSDPSGGEPLERARSAAPSAGRRDEGQPGRRFAPSDERCEFCGYRALDRHCKMVCPNCGATRDCSDP